MGTWGTGISSNDIYEDINCDFSIGPLQEGLIKIFKTQKRFKERFY